jgi:hypothetical protein
MSEAAVMRGILRSGRVVVAMFGLAIPSVAVTAGPVRADVAASEVLTWCSGASQSGQLGAINAFRCVNYLQGAADMVRALVSADLDTCLDGGQSAGAQLMARFIPELQARAAEENVDATPVARHVADWLAATCQVELTVAAATPPQETPDATAALSAALAEAEADAAAYATQVEDLQAALEVAVTGQEGELAACTASVDELTAALATSEAQAADSGMRVAELELELEGVNAEAIARRQEITEAEAQISALTDDLHAALADRLAAEQALTDAKRELNQLAAMVDENQTTANAAQAAAATASGAIAAAEQRAAEAESRVGEVESALGQAMAERDQIASDLQQITATAAEQADRLASMANDLDACQMNVASADAPAAPTPAPTPTRSAAITPPNIVTTPDPASSNGGNGSSINRAEPRQLDAIGIQTLRMMQQATLRQNAVNQRRSWATQDGRYTGFIMVLYEGYQGQEFCREIYSEARADGYLVHESTERFCQRNGYWEYVVP